MKKLKDFFAKNFRMIITGVLGVTLLAVIIGTTVAIWTNSSDSQTIVSRPTNPSEKYFSYYAAVENVASEQGYDYYPLGTIPAELQNKVVGLAVARYEGFEETVQIPSYPVVTIRDRVYNADTDQLPVIHVLYGYYNTADNLGSNGFANNSTIKNIILPETLTYVYEGAFSKMTSLQKVTVLGTKTYEYVIDCSLDGKEFLPNIEVCIDSNYKTVIDTLQLSESSNGKHYYISSTNYQMYEAFKKEDSDTYYINYESQTDIYYPNVDSTYKVTTTGPYNPSKVYFEEGAFTTDGGVNLTITSTNQVYSLSSSRKLVFEWRDASRSANANMQSYLIYANNELIPDNYLMYQSYGGRLQSLGGLSTDKYQATLIPAHDILNAQFRVLTQLYRDGIVKTSQINSSSVTLEAGHKYKIVFDSTSGSINVFEIYYELEFESNGTIQKIQLELETMNDGGILKPYQSAYERYRYDLSVSLYPQLKVNEYVSNLSGEDSASKALISTFDLSKTNAKYSNENEAFEITFSPSFVTSSTHYFTSTDSANHEVLNSVSTQGLLNAEKIYYLDEVSRIQNEEVIVTYENVNNYDEVFIIAYTLISTSERSYAYYNGMTNPISTRYENCAMTKASGSFNGLYSSNGYSIRALYNALGEKITHYYDESGNRIYEVTLSFAGGSLSGLYDKDGNAIEHVYYYYGDTLTELTSLHDKNRNTLANLTLKVLSDKYFEYTFDLKYGSPAFVKFVPGFQSEQVYNEYVVVDNSKGTIADLYYLSSTEQTINAKVDDQKYPMYLLATSTNGYWYHCQVMGSSSSTVTFNDSVSNTFANLANKVYNETNSTIENVYYLSANSGNALWNQAGAKFVLAAESSSFEVGREPAVSYYQLGSETTNGRFIYSIPTAYTYIQFLRCEGSSTAEAFSCWNYSDVISISSVKSASTYRITAWGEPCVGEWTNGVYLVAENYFGSNDDKSIKAFINLLPGDKDVDYDYQFSRTKVSFSAGTKISAMISSGASYSSTINTAHNNAVYTTASNYVKYVNNGSNHYYEILKNCTLDIYFKITYNADKTGIASYAFWFSYVSDEVDFITASAKIDASKIDSVDELTLSATRGETHTSSIVVKNSYVQIFNATEIDNEGNIVGEVVEISRSYAIGYRITPNLYNYNNGNVYFTALFSSSNANTTAKWVDLVEFESDGDNRVYLSSTPSGYSYVTVYMFEKGKAHSSTEYLFISTRISYSNGYSYLIDGSYKSMPSITYTTKQTYTTFADQSYFYILPSENMVYALENYITQFTLAFSGSAYYYMSQNAGKNAPNYEWGPNVTDSGSFNYNGSRVYPKRNVPIMTITSEQVLNAYKETGYLQLPYPEGIINESHSIYSFNITAVFTYKDNSTYTDNKFFDKTYGSGSVNSFIRNQYLNIDCNLNHLEDKSSTTATYYSLSSKAGLYFNVNGLNDFDYYATVDGVKTDLTTQANLFKLNTSSINESSVIFKSDSFYTVETQEALLQILNSYRLKRSNSNSNFEEYYVEEDIKDDAQYVISVFGKDNLSDFETFVYYGSSHTNDSIGLLSLGSGKKLLMFTPNTTCRYDSINYVIKSESGDIIAELAYDKFLTVSNGFQSFIGSIPIVTGETTYYYVYSEGNNPHLVGRYLVTNDGSIKFVPGTESEIISTSTIGGYGVVNTDDIKYSLDSYKSDSLYAAALSTNQDFKQIFPYYLVGEVNNWSLNNNYGLTFYTQGEDEKQVAALYASRILGYKYQKFSYYAIYNIYLEEGQSFRISNGSAYYEFQGITTSIASKYDSLGFNNSISYLQLQSNGYTMKVLRTGYYDIVFEEYNIKDKDGSRNAYYQVDMYRCGARVNENNLKNVDVYFQNSANWSSIDIHGFVSGSGQNVLNAPMTKYSGTINGQSNWYYYSFSYRDNDIIPDQVYFIGDGSAEVNKTTDLNFNIDDDVLTSGQMFFVPKQTNNELVVNVDNYYVLLDVRNVPAWASGKKYALYMYNDDISAGSWYNLSHDSGSLFFAQIEDSYDNMKIVVINNQFSGVSYDRNSAMVLWASETITVNPSMNTYFLKDCNSSDKTMGADNYNGTIFADLTNIHLTDNQKVYAAFADGNKDVLMVEFLSASQNIYYAINPDVTKYNEFTLYIYEGENQVAASKSIETDTDNLYTFEKVENGTISYTPSEYSSYESYIYNDSTPYLFYLRTSQNWNMNVAGLVYDLRTDTFVCEDVELTQDTEIKLFDNQGSAYAISTNYSNWKYSSTDLYSLIVGVSNKYTITANTSVESVTAQIYQYTSEYFASFNVAKAVVYDSNGNIITNYTLDYTSNANTYVCDAIYLEKGYQLYVYEANSTKYLYYYVSTLNNGYYKMFVNASQEERTDSFGWVTANGFNNVIQTKANALYFNPVKYQIVNFSPAALYNGGYIAIKDTYLSENDMKLPVTGQVDEKVDGNPYPITVYTQTEAFYAVVDGNYESVPLIWSQDTTVESKNSEYVGVITTAKKNTKVYVYNSVGGVVGSITIVFPGTYNLYYSLLTIYASSDATGKSNVTAYRVQGESIYTLWIGKTEHTDISNTYRQDYDEYLLESAISVSEDIDLVSHPITVRDTFGNVITSVTAITLFDYKELDIDEANGLHEEGTTLYVYENDKYVAVTLNKATQLDQNRKYYSLTIRSSSVLPTGVYTLKYSADNRRRANDNYLVFTYIVATKIPATKIVLYYVAKEYNISGTYYVGSDVFKVYSGTSLPSNQDIYEVNEVTEFKPGSLYYVKKTDGTTYEFEQTSVETFLPDVTYYTFNKATVFDSEKTYYTYGYSQTTVTSQSKFNSGEYYIYSEATSYDSNEIYYKYENNEYIEVSLDMASKYPLYRLVKATTYDSNAIYYTYDNQANVYNRITNQLVKDNLFICETDKTVTNTTNLANASTNDVYLYNASTNVYTKVDTFAITGYFTRQVLVARSDISLTKDIYAYDSENDSYAKTNRFEIAKDTYYVVNTITSSANFVALDTYYYGTGSNISSTSTLNIKANTYYTFEEVTNTNTDSKLVDTNAIYSTKSDGTITKVDRKDFTIAFSAGSDYYCQESFNNSLEYIAKGEDDYGYYTKKDANRLTDSTIEAPIINDDTLYEVTTLTTNGTLTVTANNGQVPYEAYTDENRKLSLVSADYNGVTYEYVFVKNGSDYYRVSDYVPNVDYWVYGEAADDWEYRSWWSGDTKTLHLVNSLTFNVVDDSGNKDSSGKAYRLGDSVNNTQYDPNKDYAKNLGYSSTTYSTYLRNSALWYVYIESTATSMTGDVGGHVKFVNGKTSQINFNNTYYIYVKQDEYTSLRLIDSTGDLVNGDTSQLVHLDYSFIDSTDPQISWSTTSGTLYRYKEYNETTLDPTKKYMTKEEGLKIKLTTNYYAQSNPNSTYYYKQNYYTNAGNLTYYGSVGRNNTSASNKRSALNFSIVNNNDQVQSGIKLYVIEEVTDFKYDSTWTYATVTSDTYSFTAYPGTTSRNGVSTSCRRYSKPVVYDDLKFTEQYYDNVAYFKFAEDGDSSYVPQTELSVDYSGETYFTYKEAEIVYDNTQTYYSTNSGKTAYFRCDDSNPVVFERNYYYVNDYANGYFNEYKNYYLSDGTEVTNALFFNSAKSQFVTDPLLVSDKYYNYVAETEYDPNVSKTYYDSTQHEVSELEFDILEGNYYCYSFLSQNNTYYDSSKIYLKKVNNTYVAVTNVNELIDLDDVYYSQSVPFTKESGYYYFATSEAEANKSPLSAFNCDEIFASYNYYYFQKATEYSRNYQYYERNEYRSPVIVPEGVDQETSFNKHVNSTIWDYYELGDTATKGSTFYMSIYNNDGYWLYEDGKYSKTDFEFLNNGLDYSNGLTKVTSSTYDKNKTYYYITDSGIQIINVTEEEFNIAMEDGKLFYGKYDYFVAARQDVALPSYKYIGGGQPEGYSFKFWVTDIDTLSKYVLYSNQTPSYADTTTVSVTKDQELVLYPTFGTASYKLFAQIGNGYTITDTNGLKIMSLPFDASTSSLSFKVNIQNGYEVGDDFAVFLQNEDGKVIYSWDTYETSYTYTVTTLQDLYLYVTVSPKTYTITLDPLAEGTVSNNKVTITYGELANIGVPTTASDVGFLYWWDNVSTIYTDSLGNLLKRWNVNSDMTLYAAYSSYFTTTINYVDMDDNPLLSTTTSKYQSGDSVRVNVTSIAGYTFNSISAYQVDVDGNVSIDLSKYMSTYSFSQPDRNVVVTVRYKITEFNIDYSLDGGTLLEENPGIYTIKDEFTLNNPTKAGYTFIGWSGTGIATTQLVVKIEKGSYNYRSYVANWSLDTTTVNYVFNESGVNNPNPTSISILDGYVELENPTLTGYQFLGWYLDKDYKNPVTEINYRFGTNSELTIYGYLEKIQYVHFDLNNLASIDVSSSSYSNFKTYFGLDEDLTILHLLSDDYKAYAYFFNAVNEQKKWVELINNGEYILSGQLPNSKFDSVILVFVKKDYTITETNELGESVEVGFDVNRVGDQANKNWLFRCAQSGNLVLDKTSTGIITNGLFIFAEGGSATIDYNNSNMPYIQITANPSKSSSIELSYTGSELFETAISESNISYNITTNALYIEYHSPLDGSVTEVSSDQVMPVGTYVMKIYDGLQLSGSYSLIVLTIKANTYDMSSVTFEDEVFERDGSSKTINVRGAVPYGVNVTYTYQALGNDAVTSNAPTNAGTYIVTAHFTSSAISSGAFAPIDDMTAYLIIHETDHTIYNAGGNDIYFGIYVNGRLTTIMTRNNSESHEFYSENLYLKKGDSISVRDSLGTSYLNWENTDITNNIEFSVISEGKHSFYFNVYSITTYVTMPSSSYSTYYIEQNHNGVITKQYFMYDNSFRVTEGSAQRDQLIASMDLKPGSIVKVYGPNGLIKVIENYLYFGFTDQNQSQFTVEYEGVYKFYLKIYESEDANSIYIDMPNIPIYLMMSSDINPSEVNVYYWSDGSTGEISWPGTPMELLPDYMQIYPGSVVYVGYVSELANHLIFNYVEDGTRVQTNSIDYSYLIGANLFTVTFGEEEEVQMAVLAHWYQNVNEFIFFESPLYTLTFNPVIGNIEVDGYNVTVVDTVESDVEGEYQYAIFQINMTIANGWTYWAYVRYCSNGTKDAPILIYDADDFSKYVCGEDFIDKSGIYFNQTVDLEISDDEGYINPFNEQTPFNNIYNGGNNKITYTQSEYHKTSYQDVDSEEPMNGLFGFIGYEGIVEDFTLQYNATVKNNSNGYKPVYYVGSVASVNLGTIRNIETTDNDQACNNIRYSGGVVGVNYGLIEGVNAATGYTVWNWGGSDPYVLGGIAGYNNGIIKDSNFTGKIEANANSMRANYIGGIAGLDSGEIINCTCTGIYGSNNTNALVNEISNKSRSQVYVYIENDWWLYRDSYDGDLTKPYDFESALKVNYYDNESNLIGSLVYTYDQFMKQSPEGSHCVQIDLLENTYTISLSRVLFITSEATDRVFYSTTYTLETVDEVTNEVFTFVKLGDDYVCYPEDTYSVTVSNADLVHCEDGETAIYLYATSSTTKYATSQTSTNSADYVLTQLAGVEPLASTITLYNIGAIFRDSFKVIYLDENNKAIKVSVYPSGTTQITVYEEAKSMIFTNYVLNEGESIDDIHRITCEMTGMNYMMDLYFYVTDGVIGHSFGYNSSLPLSSYNDGKINLYDLIPDSINSNTLMEVDYYNAAGEKIARAQYTASREMQIHNFLGSASIAISLTYNSVYGQNITISVPLYTEIKDSEGNTTETLDHAQRVDDLYIFLEVYWYQTAEGENVYGVDQCYNWLAKWNEEAVNKPIINHYLELMDETHGIMIEHYDVNNVLFKIDYYDNDAMSNDLNVTSFLKCYPSTAYCITRKLSNILYPPLYPESLAVEGFTAGYTGTLYLSSIGDTEYYTLTGQETPLYFWPNIFPGTVYIEKIYLTEEEESPNKLKVYNEVSWYGNNDAFMKVYYYNRNMKLIGIRTYDVQLENDITIFENTAYMLFCRLCSNAEYNYKLIEYNESGILLISGDNVLSWQSESYLPIMSTVPLYNYIAKWNELDITVNYYNNKNELIQTHDYNPKTSTINVYKGTQRFDIYYGDEHVSVTQIVADNNLYLCEAVDGTLSAVWSKPLSVAKVAEIPVHFASELSWWNYIMVDYYTPTGIMITSIKYPATTTSIDFLKNTGRIEVRVNGSSDELVTLPDLVLDKTLYFGLDVLKNSISYWGDNNADELDVTTQIKLTNSISWWAGTESLTKIYFYSDDVLLTIQVISSTELAYIDLYEGTNSMKIVRLSGLNEMNSINLSAIYPSKTLSLHSPALGVAAASWVTETIDVDETPDYLYFDLTGIDVKSASLKYTLADGTNGSLDMTKDSDVTAYGYYKVLWNKVLTVNPQSVVFAYVNNSDEEVTFAQMQLSSIDIDDKNIFSANTSKFTGHFSEFTPYYLYMQQTSSWNQYYASVEGSEGNQVVQMQYMSDNGYYCANLYTKYVNALDATLQFTSDPADIFVIKTDKMACKDIDASNNIYTVYGIGVILGIKDEEGNEVKLISDNKRIDSETAGFYDVSQYVFGNVGAWVSSTTAAKNETIYQETVAAAITKAGLTETTYADIVNQANELQYYSYSVGGMNGWSVGQFRNGMSYIGRVDGRYMFYNYLSLSEPTDHKVQLSNSWARNYSDDNNTTEYEYSTDGTYVQSKYDGQENIHSAAGNYLVCFAVNEGKVEASENNFCNEAGIYVITCKNKYTVTWIIGDKTLTEQYVEGQTPSYKGETPSKDSTTKYDYEFAGWTPSLSPVTQNVNYEAKFNSIIRKYDVTYIDEFGNTSNTLAKDYGTIISNLDNVPDSIDGYAFAGWYLDQALKTSAEGIAIRTNTTLYAKWYKLGVYLVGQINGVIDYESQDYQLVKSSTGNVYTIKNVFLKANDFVTVTNLAEKLVYNNFDCDHDLYDLYTNDGYLTIKENAYYEFNLSFASDVATVTINQAFKVTLDVSSEDFESYDIDHVFVIKGTDISTISLTDPIPKSSAYVFAGWFDDNGDSVTTITTNITIHASLGQTGVYLSGTVKGEDKSTSTDYQLSLDSINSRYYIEYVELNAGDTVDIKNYLTSTTYNNWNDCVGDYTSKTPSSPIVIAHDGFYTFYMYQVEGVDYVKAVEYHEVNVVDYESSTYDESFSRVMYGTDINTIATKTYNISGYYSSNTYEEEVTQITENQTVYAKQRVLNLKVQSSWDILSADCPYYLYAWGGFNGFTTNTGTMTFVEKTDDTYNYTFEFTVNIRGYIDGFLIIRYNPERNPQVDGWSDGSSWGQTYDVKPSELDLYGDTYIVKFK